MSKYNGLYENKKEFEEHRNNNCYTYAINQPVNPYTDKPYEYYEYCQPGFLGGKGIEPDYSYDERLVELAKKDLKNLGYKLIKSSFKGYIDDKNCWKVAFCYGDNDYHWYRQNKDGTWSHKWGEEKVKYKDENGKIIRNPETCNRGKYKYFGGYFLIKKVS